MASAGLARQQPHWNWKVQRQPFHSPMSLKPLLSLTLPEWSPVSRKSRYRLSGAAHGNARFCGGHYRAAAGIRVPLQALQFGPHI